MIEAELSRSVQRWCPGATAVSGAARLSGGASQETWRFDIVHPDGAIWFTDNSNNQIGRIDPTVINPLVTLLGDESDEVRAQATKVLGEVAQGTEIGALIERLRDSSPRENSGRGPRRRRGRPGCDLTARDHWRPRPSVAGPGRSKPAGDGT